MQTNNESKQDTEKKPSTPFIAPGSLEEVTQEELEKRNRRIARAEALGINIARVTFDKKYNDEYENPYEVEALLYILNDMDVPEEVIQKMKEYDKMNAVR